MCVEETQDESGEADAMCVEDAMCIEEIQENPAVPSSSSNSNNNNSNSSSNRGRKRIPYTPDLAEKAEEYAKKGLIDKQIAHNLGISPQTLCRWKNEYPDFAEALRRGKEVVDQEVENALFMRATGYSHPEDKIFLGPGGEPVIVPTIKHYPPDTTAMIFWLKNRRPEEWRDRRDVEMSGNLKFTISLPGGYGHDAHDVVALPLLAEGEADAETTEETEETEEED